MKRIFKYPVEVQDEIFTLMLPIGAEITGFQQQGESYRIMTIWAMADESSPVEIRRFKIVGTGHKFNLEPKNVFTALAPPFVWHLLDLGPEE